MTKKRKAATAVLSTLAAEIMPPAGPPVPASRPAYSGAVVNLEGRLVEIELGREEAALLADLEHRMSTWPKDASCSPALGFQSEDPAVCFARAVHEKLGGALFRCEEREPISAPWRVIYVIVERDAARWRKMLRGLATEHFGPVGANPARPRVEVVDRETEESTQRQVDAGLLAKTVARARPLWPQNADASVEWELTPLERRLAAEHRRVAARKLRMAMVLARGELEEEARQAALEALEPLGRALAVENHLPEPISLEDALLPPLAPAWKEALPALCDFLREATKPVLPLVAVLERL